MDRRDVSLAGHVSNTTASDLEGQAAGAVVMATRPTLARTTKDDRTP
jgi:hypothetical protein